MTREEARKAAEVMIAYADGKEIEFKVINSHLWTTIIDDALFDWIHNDYRIKKEPTYRPFKGKDECWSEMQKHQPFGWVKDKENGDLTCLTCISNELDFIYFYKETTFADRTPFGIKDE